MKTSPTLYWSEATAGTYDTTPQFIVLCVVVSYQFFKKTMNEARRHLRLMEEVDARRARVSNFLGAQLEEGLFARHFYLWPRREHYGRTRFGIAKIIAHMQNAYVWRRYFLHARHLKWNLRHSAAAREKQTDTQWLLNARPWQLFPEKWPNIDAATLAHDWRDEEHLDSDEEEEQRETSFVCYKCGSHKVTYTQLQTRSADEGLTTYFYCTNCHKRWKG